MSRRLNVHSPWPVDADHRCAICIATEYQQLWLTADEARQLAIDLVTAAELADKRTTNGKQADIFEDARTA